MMANRNYDNLLSLPSRFNQYNSNTEAAGFARDFCGKCVWQDTLSNLATQQAKFCTCKCNVPSETIKVENPFADCSTELE